MKKKGKRKAVSQKYRVSEVTQKMLCEYRELCEYTRRKDKLREELVTLLENGASVEPGPLTAAVEVVERLTPSWPRLQEVLGRSSVKAIREQIQPALFRYLRVHVDVIYHPDWQ